MFKLWLIDIKSVKSTYVHVSVMNFGGICWFLLLFYICIAVGDPIIKRERVGIPVPGLTSPHFCVCPKPGHGFPTSYMYRTMSCSVSELVVLMILGELLIITV